MGDTTQRTTPTQVGSGTTWVAVTAGWAHACARQSDGPNVSCAVRADGTLR